MNSLIDTVRSLRRSLLTSGISIATLGIGVGLCTSMACVLLALLVRPAPFQAPSELFRIEAVASNGTRSGLSVPEIEAIEHVLGPEAHLIPFRWVDAVLSEPGQPPESHVAIATLPTFFPELGVPALLGRTYGPQDVITPDAPIAVLGFSFWQRRFQGDPSIVGSVVTVNRRPVTVLGIMPPSFDYRQLWAFGDLWMPGTFMQDGRDQLEARQHPVIARVPAKSKPAAVQAGLDAASNRLIADHPVSHQGFRFALTPLAASTVEPGFRRLVMLASGICVAVLAIICANVASLQLARALGRSHEHAVRSAMGASPRILVTATLRESLVLGSCASILGLATAMWCNDVLSARLTIGLAGKLDLGLDATAVGVALGLALAASCAAGLGPAMLASRGGTEGALRRQPRGATEAPTMRRLRRALIAGEIALAVALVSTAAALTGGLWDFMQRPVGWEPDDVTFGTIVLPLTSYGSTDARRRFHQRLLEELGTQPEVTASTLATLPPLYSYWTTASYRVAGVGDGRDARLAFRVLVAPSFFDTLGIEVLEGRPFTRNEGDDRSAVIINRRLAATLWPSESAIGKRLVGAAGSEPREVIAVVSDVDFPANPETPATPYQVYEPFAHEPWGYITLAVRGPAGLRGSAAAMRRAVATLDPAIPVQDVTNASAEISRHLGNLQLVSRALTGFSIAGVVLATIGIYGTLAHDVARRRRELGIRLALGATPTRVVAHVLISGGRLVLLGLLGGAFAAAGAARVMQATLARIPAVDPWILAAAGGLIAAAGLLACWVPARAASRVDPLEEIRGA